MRLLTSLLCAVLMTGCHADPLSTKNDPKSPWWELAFTEPHYMKVWVEDTAVEDIKGKTFLHTGGGSASGGQPEDGTDSARGWHGVGSTGKSVVGADLPKRIYVRWQSIVEPHVQGLGRYPRGSQTTHARVRQSALRQNTRTRGAL